MEAHDVQEKLLRLAVQDLGGCLSDLGILLAQGIRADNEAKRGSIAVGLERAAAHVRGQLQTFEENKPKEVAVTRLPEESTTFPRAELDQTYRNADPADGAAPDGKDGGDAGAIGPKFRHLGQSSATPKGPDAAILEAVKFDGFLPPPGKIGSVIQNSCFRFTCPEFTSLCPATGQPDFATIVIDYIPNDHIVESKSLKLYLGSFRNHGAFHESCTLQIAREFYDTCSPKWLRIAAYWYPRGGIPIDVFWQSGEPPKYALIPELTTPQYRGR